MELRIEWRTTGDTGNSIVFIDDDSNSVSRVIDGDSYKNDARALGVFLNDIPDLDAGWEEKPVADANRDPASWGHLVMARANSGEVLEMDPVLFWHSISIQFRLRGTDAWVQPRHAEAG